MLAGLIGDEVYFQWAGIAGIFLLAGFVKGVVGMGLPTISLGLLILMFELPEAMVLLLVPSFVTNLWQAFVGGQAFWVLKKVWPFLCFATSTVWLGAQALLWLDFSWLSILLGWLLMIYGGLSLYGLKFSLGASPEVWIGPLFGVVNGVFTGMTGAFTVPGVFYLQGLGLPRVALMQAMGMLFSLSTLALAFALQSHQLFSPEKGLWSMFGLAPALLGMWLGQMLAKRLSAELFRITLHSGFLLLGGYILVQALVKF